MADGCPNPNHWWNPDTKRKRLGQLLIDMMRELYHLQDVEQKGQYPEEVHVCYHPSITYLASCFNGNDSNSERLLDNKAQRYAIN